MARRYKQNNMDFTIREAASYDAEPNTQTDPRLEKWRWAI
jgi:hypothetical protein